MDAVVADQIDAAFEFPRAGLAWPMPDPLERDCVGDEAIHTTRRGLTRVALVATEVASRFQREVMAHDAMAWMLAPRALFYGAAAIDACLDRDACLRGVLLHGLSLGLDADPATIDSLVSDNDADLVATDPDRTVTDNMAEFTPRTSPTGGRRRGNVIPFRGAPVEPRRLFTATVVADNGARSVQAFHASLAVDEVEVAARLRCRIGSASSDARIVDGFDPSDPLVASLVSSAICDTLRLIEADPASPLAAGLDVNIEQSFAI